MTARVRGIWINHKSALVATLLFAVIFSLTMVALRGSTRSRASGGIQYRLEGYDKVSASWTPGNVAGYAEQESIPFRLTVENNTSTPSNESLRLKFDHLRDSTLGIDYFVTSGTIMNGFVANLTGYGVTGPFFSGDIGYYDVSFTVPANSSVTLMWGAHLATGSHLWPGASLHVFVDGIGYSIGERDVPIPVQGIFFLTISKTDFPDPIYVGDTTVYTIVVTAGGTPFPGGPNANAQSNVTVTDTLPGGLTYVSSSPPGTVSGNTITWNVGSLAAGQNTTITLTVQGIAPGTWTDYVEVKSDQVPTPVSATQDTTVQTPPYATISGTKFDDLNGNGARDPGEPGLPDWTINLSGPKSESTQTDLNGNYSFSNLSAGTYTISEDLQTGWTRTYPTAPGTHTVTVSPGQVASGKDFGNFKNAGISGHKYEDTSGNGENLSPLGGWKIYLKDSQGNTLATATTSSEDGSYSFTNLGPGTYTVVEEDQTGWVHIGPSSYTVTVSSGQTSSDRDFRNFEKAMISGTKFSDLDRDAQDREYDFSTESWEPGLAGWTIFLTDMQGHLITQTTTDQNGNFFFTDLGPGTYIVSEQAQSGWVLTFPAPGTYTVTTLSGQHFDGNNFGNFQLPITSYGIIQGIKFYDENRNGVRDPGEPGLPGWTITLYASDGTTVLNTTATGSDGSYKFDNLAAGTYWVGETLLPDWDNMTPLKVKSDIVIVDGEVFVTIADFGNVLAVLPFTPTEGAAPAKEGVLPITGGNPVSILLRILLAAASAATLFVFTGIGLRLTNKETVLPPNE